MSNSSNRLNLSFVSEGPFRVVMTGSDEDDLIDDEQYQYLSPYEASKSPMNDPPSLVKPEEIIIVGGVLILWISVIALFIHKWGKIRGLEPYIPHFDRTSLHAHPNGAATTTTTTTVTTNQVTGVTVQATTAPSIYSSAAINVPSSSSATVTIGQAVSVEGAIKSYSEQVAGDTSDASQVSHETRVRRYNINKARSNKPRVNLSSKTSSARKTSGKDKWLQPYTRPPSDWSDGGGGGKFKSRAIEEEKQTQVNKNVAAATGRSVGVRVVRDVITSRDNLHEKREKKKYVHSSHRDDYLCVSEEEPVNTVNTVNTVNERQSINDNLSINSSGWVREERIRRKRSREYFYPYSSRRPRASIDSSNVTANHIAQYSLNSPLVSNERLLQSHGVDFRQSPYLKHKQNVTLQQANITQSVQFNNLPSYYKPVHRWREQEQEQEQIESRVKSQCESRASDKTSGNEKNDCIQLNDEDEDEDAPAQQLNRPFASNGHKRCRLKGDDEILHEYRSYIDMPSLVLLRMAQSEPNIAESRLDS